jgi:putative ABC transport system permease protein
MNTLLQDVRYGARMLVKAPGFTAVSIITLTLGIGATTAMFSVLNQALLAPLPYPHPEQLVHLNWRSPSRGTSADALNGRQGLYIQQNNTVFSSTAAMFYAPGCNLVSGNQVQYVDQASVSPDFFRTFGVRPLLGRGFLPSDPSTGPAQVAIVSYGLWKERMGSDPNAIGRTIKCNGQPYTVVGVLPQTFSFPEEPADVWIPDRFENYAQDSGSNYWMVGRIKDGMSLDQAQQQIAALSMQFHKEFPEYAWDKWETGPDGIVNLTSLRSWRVGDERKQTLLLLFGAVSLVLLIAAANVAGLILARATGRTREIATRLALGATRARLGRQLLTETVLLALIGGVWGLVIAVWSVGLLTPVIPQEVRTAPGFHFSLPVLGFCLVITLVAGVLAGLAPALRAAQTDLSQSLKQGEHGSNSAGQSRLRRLLIVSEVALALLLLVGSTLLVRSFLLLRNVSPGFDPRGIYVAELSLGSTRYQKTDAVAGFQRDVLARVRAIPGVTAAATITAVPARRDLNLGLTGGTCDQGASIQYRAISPGYFELMGIPLRRGRTFTENESAPAVILNEAVARRCWAGKDPIGDTVTKRSGSLKDGPRQIVGIVGDTRDYGLSRPATATVYVPQWQVPDGITRYQNGIFYWSIVMRAPGTPGLAQAVASAVRQADAEQSVVAFMPLTSIVGQWLQSSRLMMQLMGAFAGLALLLTAVGLYGVLSYYVSQRTREIGIRMALGAARRHVLGLVIAEGMALVASGAAIGLLGGIAATRLMKSMLFGVRPTDPLTFAVAIGFLCAVALLASYIPARRATKVDPMVALRYE